MRVSNVTVRKRLLFVLLFGVIVFLIIDTRLGYVQFVMGEKLTSLAKDSWSRNLPFEPERGEILDRNGVKLATNKSAPTVFVVPRQVQNPMKTSKQLAAVLNMSEEKVYKHVTKKASIEKITPEGRKISNEKAKEIKALDLKGVYVAEDSIRHYPFGSFLSHVLGFAGIDNQGLLGLEAYYDDDLKGEKGSVKFYTDAKGKKMPDEADDYTPPKDGLDMKLTVDSKVQTIMERELDNAEAKYHPDGMIAVAMNPKNGEILGMSSRPDFDPADYQSVDPSVYNRNLPVWSTYEPGSTFKIITLAAALEEQKVNLKRDQFYDKGHAEVDGARLRCWKRGGHGLQTYLEVVQNSCNPGFVELGERLGKEKLAYKIEGFDVAGKTGTAQIAGKGGYLDGTDNYIFSFMGMAPKDDPELLIYVAVQQPQLKAGQSSSDPVSEIFNPTMKNSLHYLNIEPTEKSDSDKEETKAQTMPDLTDQTVAAAQKKAKEENLTPIVIGSDVAVKEQYPKADEEVLTNQKVFLKTGGKIKMPDMTGWSRREVLQYGELAGIHIEVSGQGYAVSQSVKKDKEIKDKTVIKVKFKNPD